MLSHVFPTSYKLSSFKCQIFRHFRDFDKILFTEVVSDSSSIFMLCRFFSFYSYISFIEKLVLIQTIYGLYFTTYPLKRLLNHFNILNSLILESEYYFLQSCWVNSYYDAILSKRNLNKHSFLFYNAIHTIYVQYFNEKSIKNIFIDFYIFIIQQLKLRIMV